MGKKIVIILVCMLFIFTTLSTVAARQERTAFKDCYIEVEARGEGLYNMIKYVFLRPYQDDRAFVLCWIIQWMGPEYVTVKIYDQKNGNELWNNQNEEGIWAFKLFLYNGKYNWDGQEVFTLQGTTKATVVLNEG